MVENRFPRREDLGLTSAEFGVLRRLDSPRRIQDFVYGLKQNFEVGGETCLTVREVLRTRRAHCIEGAMLSRLRPLGERRAAAAPRHEGGA